MGDCETCTRVNRLPVENPTALVERIDEAMHLAGRYLDILHRESGDGKVSGEALRTAILSLVSLGVMVGLGRLAGRFPESKECRDCHRAVLDLLNKDGKSDAIRILDDMPVTRFFFKDPGDDPDGLPVR